MKAPAAVLVRLRALPLGWQLVVGAVAALALAGAVLAAREVVRELHGRTRGGAHWNPADPCDADPLLVFDVLAENTGITGNRGEGLRMFVQSRHYYWFALDVGKDGGSRAVFFALELPTDQRLGRVLGPRTVTYSPAETQGFLARLDGHLRHYWGLEGPRRGRPGDHFAHIAWERTTGGERFGGRSDAVPHRTYGEVSADLLALLGRRLGPGELPGPAWEWPAASAGRPAGHPRL